MNFTGSRMEDVHLQHSTFHGARMDGMRLIDSRLQHTKLAGVTLDMSILDAWFDHADMRGASLRSTDLTGASLQVTNMQSYKVTKLQS